MSIILENTYSFPQELVAKAAAFPTGHFVEVDDLAFESNGLGRKIVQTQLVMVDEREVSMGYVSEGEAGYELIVSDENPTDLGSFDNIIRGDMPLFSALQQAFGGSMSSYTHSEMVWAIVKARSDGVSASEEGRVRSVAAWARTQAKRAAWVLRNRVEALVKAPVDWKSVGI